MSEGGRHRPADDVRWVLRDRLGTFLVDEVLPFLADHGEVLRDQLGEWWRVAADMAELQNLAALPDPVDPVARRRAEAGLLRAAIRIDQRGLDLLARAAVLHALEGQ